MNIFKRDITSNNASCWKRVFSFTLDMFIVNIFRALLLQLLLVGLMRNRIIAAATSFSAMFGDSAINGLADVKDYHIRYVVQSDLFTVAVLVMVVVFFTGIIYNIICYSFGVPATLGQRCMNVRVANFNDNQRPSTSKLLARAVLVPLPIMLMMFCSFFSILNFLEIYRYFPHIGFTRTAIAKCIEWSTLNGVVVMAIIFGIVWYDMYFLTNRFIMTDLITSTRVIDMDITEDGDKKYYLVDLIDSLVEQLKKLNQKLLTINKKMFNSIKDKFSKREK